MALGRSQGSLGCAFAYLAWLVIIGLIVVGVVILVPQISELRNKRKNLKKTEQEKGVVESQLVDAKNENKSLQKASGVEKVARERYRMVKPGDKVLRYDVKK